MVARIPESHLDLVSDAKPVVAVLATIMRDGTPQATPVWFDMEGELIRINTARGRVKDENMKARPNIALTMVDPEDPYRYLTVRGQVVENSEEGAREHINRLSEKYRGHPNYPVREGETRVIYRVQPRSVFVRK